jgi:hypothetical protein
MFFRAPKIGESDEPDKLFLAVDHWKAANLMLRHHPGSFVNIIVLEAVAHTFRHYLAYACIAGRALFGDRADDDVAIRHYPGEAAVLAHRQCADIVCTHASRRITYGHIWVGEPNRRLHELLYLHGLISWNEVILKQRSGRAIVASGSSEGGGFASRGEHTLAISSRSAGE